VRDNKPLFYFLIFITFLITAISFRSYFKYASYNLDDYATFEFARAGASVWEACRATTDWLFAEQQRFQPVRLCIFVAFTHLFAQESSVYYNFALHLVNILLLFLFLRKFGVGKIFSFISVLIFAVFGRFRFMDCSSAMIGGSGLNLFFILLTFLFLIKALEAGDKRSIRGYLFLGISVLAYTSLVFSYEVAVPLFAPVVAVFYLFNREGKGLLGPIRSKKLYYLFLYLVPLAVYLVFFRLLVKVNYEGAEVRLGPEIFIRMAAYLFYTLVPPFPTHGLITAEFIILALYLGGVFFVLKREGRPIVETTEKKNEMLRLLFFSAVFYPSTVVIFTLNHWLKPTNVMVHHTYLMTAASSMLVASFFYSLQWVLLPNYRRKYLAIMALFVVPVVLINAERHMVNHYKDDAGRVTRIRRLKNTLTARVSDIDGTDAIILKNFYYPYYDISSVEGAYLKWFGFRKDILSGREIVSVRDGEIVYKGPLQRYKKPEEERRVRNDRVRIFFVRKPDGAVLPYSNYVDFKRGENLFQTEQVMGDCPDGDCTEKGRLDLILSNFERNRYLNIWFRSSGALEKFMKTLSRLEINGAPVPRGMIMRSGARLSIDLGRTKGKINYYFLTVISHDDGLREKIRRIELVREIKAGKKARQRARLQAGPDGLS